MSSIRVGKSPLSLGEEGKHQAGVMRYLAFQYPAAYAVACASAGGLHTSKAQGVKMKAMGYRAGFPDLVILYPTKKYHGLMIEMKAPGRYATPEQKEWIQRLNDRGYMATVCKSFDEAKAVIDDYMATR